MEGESADVWKENILKDLEAGVLEYETTGQFLADIKKEFGEGDEETVKEVEGIMRAGATGSKVKQCRSTMTTIVTASSLAKDVGSSTTGANRVYSYRRSEENECSYGTPNLAGRVCTSQSICHGYRQRE